MPDIKDTGIYLDFGILDSTEWSEDSAAEIYERRLEMAEFADKNDFFLRLFSKLPDVDKESYFIKSL